MLRSPSASSTLALFIAFATLACTLIAPGKALAQGDREHWGVTASFTPAWDTAPAIREFLEEEEGDEVNFKGNEFTIGVVHGRPFGGDISFNFSYRKFTEEPVLKSSETNCFQPGQNQPQVCTSETETTTPQDAFMIGGEVNWFLPFVRIKDRVQIGMNLGGGIGINKGNVVTVTDGTEANFVPGPGGGSTKIVPFHEEEVLKFADELLPIMPLAKLEAVGSFLIGPSFKVKAAYGINFPSYSFRLTGTYLFGG